MTEKAVHREINRAQLLFDRLGPTLQRDGIISALLKLYQKAGHHTAEIMEQSGIVRACTRCALEGEGSCCFPGVENQYDSRLLLADLLLGGNLPLQGEIPGRCFFVGKTGCKLAVRHYYCLRFLCPDLQDSLLSTHRHILLEATLKQIALGWELEQALQAAIPI